MIKVFISHSSKDKKFARTLKEDLNENGIETWLDEDSLDFGDSLIEKIELSLDESSHFMIILSPNSVQSDWVKLELKKALNQVSTNPLNKIIPIKYKECEVPKEIKGLLHGDLSNEVVQIIKDKVIFTTEGYSQFLTKLIRSLKSPSNKLTILDKTKLKEEFLENEKNSTSKRDFIANMYLEPQAFASFESRMGFVNRIKSETQFQDIKNSAEKISPILLPRILSKVFTNIQIGQELKFINETKENNISGYFAGFRRDDIKITLPIGIRHFLSLEKEKLYLFRFDWNEKTITIMTQ